MNEQSYIELYEEMSPLIKSKSASLLNLNRDDAFAKFKALGFPAGKDESYLYCKLSERMGIDYGLNINRISIPMDPGEVITCEVPGINSHLYYVVNDVLYASADNKHALPAGVVVCRMSEACEQHEELVKHYLGKETKDHNDGFIAFNEMFSQDGYFIYVPKGVELENPIQIINIMRSDVDFLTTSRNLIILEANAKAKLLVCEHSMDRVNFFADRVTECFLADGANLEYNSLENTHAENYYLSHLFVNQSRDSRLVSNTIGLNNGETRNHVEVNLNGEGAEVVLGGMLVSDRTQRTDNYTVIRHNVPRCKSQELYKYILDESAVGAFTGRVVVADQAQKTEAYQTNRNICLTKEARMYARPQLEIYADDVKCGHGATTGQLDETALFYMQARGIGKAEARMLLLLAFTADIIEQVSVEALRNRLHMMVEKRLRGERLHCKSCSMCNS